MSDILMSTAAIDQISAIHRYGTKIAEVSFWKEHKFWLWTMTFVCFLVGVYWASSAFAAGSIPGTDASDKLEAAGTLLRILDTALFKWGARIFAGVCIMSSAWSLKEQRFGIAIICIVGALIFGTAPTWVRNIFSIGTNASVFEQ